MIVKSCDSCEEKIKCNKKYYTVSLTKHISNINNYGGVRVRFSLCPQCYEKFKSGKIEIVDDAII